MSARVPAGVRRNFVYNVIGLGIPIVVSIGTVPLYIDAIGTARYGVVAIAWVLLGYFGFLDFGLSRASANALSRLVHAPASERSPVLATALWLNVGLGACGGLLLYGGARLLMLHAFRIPADLLPELRPALPWLAAMLPLGMINGVAGGALDSRERFLLSSMLSSFGTVIGQLVPLACAYLLGPSLSIVIPALLLSRLVSVIASFVVVARIERPLRLLSFDRAWVRRLFGYGVWVSVSSVLVPILDSLDQMLIGTILGASSVAKYSIPMNLTLRSQIVANALARTLFPRLSRLSPDDAVRTAQDAVVALAYGFGLIIAPAILFSNLFLHLWVGADIARVSGPVAQILLFGAWTNGMAVLPYSLLQGQGRPDLTAKAHLAEVLPFIGILLLLLHRFGLPGAALAWSCRMTADCIILMFLSRFSGQLLLRLAPPALVLLATVLAARSDPSPTSLVVFAAAAMTGLLVCGLAFVPMLRSQARRFLPGMSAPAKANP